MLMKKSLLVNKLAVLSGAIAIVCSLLACSDQETSARLAPGDYPESGTETVELYLNKCGSCHAAPLPSIHTKKQWFGVVQRMQFRMTNKAIKPLNQRELEIIVDYLEKHAR